jgi:hypothetical protein
LDKVHHSAEISATLQALSRLAQDLGLDHPCQNSAYQRWPFTTTPH